MSPKNTAGIWYHGSNKKIFPPAGGKHDHAE